MESKAYKNKRKSGGFQKPIKKKEEDQENLVRDN